MGMRSVSSCSGGRPAGSGAAPRRGRPAGASPRNRPAGPLISLLGRHHPLGTFQRKPSAVNWRVLLARPGRPVSTDRRTARAVKVARRAPRSGRSTRDASGVWKRRCAGLPPAGSGQGRPPAARGGPGRVSRSLTVPPSYRSRLAGPLPSRRPGSSATASTSENATTPGTVPIVPGS
jgi:hypothetical protein